MLEASHEEEAASVGEIGQSDECDFCLAMGNGFRDQVEARHKSFVDQSQAFLTFAMPNVVGLPDAGSCIMADHPSGKPLYVLTFRGSVLPTLSAPIPAERPELFTTLFKHSVELTDFQAVFRLSAGSASNRRDNLRAFLFAITAMDSFLTNFFSENRQRLVRHRKDHLSPAIRKYVEETEQRIDKQGRAEDDRPLAYKFALIASYLGFQDLERTYKEFNEATKQLVAVTHGYDYDEATLPAAKVRQWLGELVRLQVAAKTLL